MNPKTLTIPVPYTLTMKGNGNFVAKWEPPVPTPGLPSVVVGESRSSGIRALERLYEALKDKGVI